MAVLTRDDDTNETIIKVDDVFDTFYSKSEVYTKGEVNTKLNTKINKSGDTGMTGTFNFLNAIVNVSTPALP